MTYPNYMAQQPYYPNNMYSSHPNYFTNAMQQNYNTQPQQNITNQAPVTQPNVNSTSKIILVSTKEEATGSPVDLVNGIPSFFYNKSNGEIYLKQFDVPNGTAIFKTYLQVKEPIKQDEEIHNINYEKELHYISEGIDNLHRILMQIQNNKGISIEEPSLDVIDIEPNNIEIVKKPRGKKHA